MNRQGITKQESQVIKGVAILLIFFYHLLQENRISLFDVKGVSDGLALVAAACHSGLTLFVFVTAYGMSVQQFSAPFCVSRYLKQTTNRYRRLTYKTGFALSILMLIASLLEMDYNSTVVWGNNPWSCVIGALSNIIGLARFFGINWFSPTWWYLWLYVLLIFLVPLLASATKKIPAHVLLFITLTGVPLFGFSTVRDALPRYLVVIVLGILAARQNWIEKLWVRLKNRKRICKVFLIVLFAMVVFAVAIRAQVTCVYLVDAFITICLVLMITFTIRLFPFRRNLFAFIGGHSQYIWLLHPFFINHWFREFVYSWKNVWLIAVISFSFVLLSAVVLDCAYQKISTLLRTSALQPRRMAPWQIALGSVCVLVIITVCTSTMGYLTNDDGGIQNLLAGNVTGEPYITHQFINIILGSIISFLYRIVPQIQWWYWFSMAEFLLSVCVIHYCFFKIRKGVHAQIFALFIIGCLDIGFLIYALANIAFTMVPAVLGTAVMTTWMTARPNCSPKSFTFMKYITVLAVVIMICHRRDSGLALLCYILMAVLYYLTQREKTFACAFKKFSGLSTGVVLLAVFLVAINNTATLQINGEEFVAFNKARVAYMDHPKQTYSDNPNIYNQVGWSADVATLVSSWCFIDENVTTESFLYLSENSPPANEDYIRLLTEFLSDARASVMLILAIVSMIMAGYVQFCRRNWHAVFFLCANNIGTCILLIYQLLTGRVLYRSAFVVLLPCFCFNMLLLLKSFPLQPKRIKHVSCLAVALFVSVVSCSSIAVFDKDRDEYKQEACAQASCLESYAMANENIVYVTTTSMYNPINPWTIYIDRRPTNIIAWGGSSYHSNSFVKRLSVNGLDALNADTFLDESVRFVFGLDMTDPKNIYDGNIFQTFFHYLKTNTDIEGFVLEDTISPTAYVYRFVTSEGVSNSDLCYTITDHGELTQCVSLEN